MTIKILMLGLFVSLTAFTSRHGNAASAAATEPFNVLEITHVVQDYAKWRAGFDLDSTMRKANGLSLIVVGRGLDNPNKVNIVLAVSDVQKAKEFLANPRLKDVMEKNGVISAPEIYFYQVVRYNRDAMGKQWVTITHHVRDFDAWAKVFDGEGPATRATQGFQDVALARELDDPNMVHIVFYITDMEKAKTAMTSEDKKKTMMDAGVDSMPKFEFFTVAE